MQTYREIWGGGSKSWNMCSKSCSATSCGVWASNLCKCVKMCASKTNCANSEKGVLHGIVGRMRFHSVCCWKPQNPQNLWPHFAARQIQEIFAIHAATVFCICTCTCRASKWTICKLCFIKDHFSKDKSKNYFQYMKSLDSSSIYGGETCATPAALVSRP